MKKGNSRLSVTLSWPASHLRGFTVFELAVALGILLVLAGFVLFNLGTFFGTGNFQARDAEQYRVVSAVAKYRFDDNVITEPFTVGPNDAKGLGSYLSKELQYYWSIGTDGTVRPVAAGAFSSDLNSSNRFIVLKGDWTAAGGVLSTGKDQGWLVAKGGPWDDFIFQAAATLVSGSAYGMYYRCDTKPDISGYLFQFHPGLGNKFVARRVMVGNEFSPLQQVNMPAGFPVNEQHHISVSLKGDHHVIKVDGSTVLDFHDSQYRAGTVGLGYWSNSQVNFTSFKVSPQ